MCEAITHHACLANSIDNCEEGAGGSPESEFDTEVAAPVGDPIDRVDCSTKQKVIEERIASIATGICDQCDEWVSHIENAGKSRRAYRHNRDTYPEKGVYYFSADMQKITMLPRLHFMKHSRH